MKTFTAVLVGAVLGGVVTAGVMCHLLERQKALARQQATEIARLRVGTPPPKPTWGRTGQASVSESVAEQQLHAERRSLFERELRLKARVKEWAEAAERRRSMSQDGVPLAEALESSEGDERVAALLTLLALPSDTFRKIDCSRQVESLLASSDTEERLLALRVFTRGGMPGLQDEKLLRSLLDDPSISVRQELVGSIYEFHRKDLTGAGGETVLRLLQNPEPRDPRWVETLSRATLSPALEQRLIELARENGGSSEMARAVENTCLRTQMNKSEACVEFLLEKLTEPDAGLGGRDMDGFFYGRVPKALAPKVAQTAVQFFEEQSGAYAKLSALSCLQCYADASHIETMSAWAQLPDLSPAVRGHLEGSIKAVADRLRREAGSSQ